MFQTSSLYNDFSTADEQAQSLNTTVLLIQKRIQALRKALLATDDPIVKLDVFADMLAAVAAISSLTVAYDIASRDIADTAKSLIQ